MSEEPIPEYPVRLTLEEAEYLLDLHENERCNVKPSWDNAPMVYRLHSKLAEARRELDKEVPEEADHEQ
jgi:hypothetical protein